MWKENLMNNLIVFLILGSLIIIVYCKVTKKSLKDMIIEIKEGFAHD